MFLKERWAHLLEIQEQAREDGSPDIPDGGERRSKRTAQSTGSDALGEEDKDSIQSRAEEVVLKNWFTADQFVKPEESYTISLFPSARGTEDQLQQRKQ